MEKKQPKIPEKISKTAIVPIVPPVALAPNTTHEENITTAGQRRINLIWEFTQAFIAIAITMAIIYNAVTGVKSDVITNAFFLIVSMYFIRTNHSLIGGTGQKPNNQQR